MILRISQGNNEHSNYSSNNKRYVEEELNY